MPDADDSVVAESELRRRVPPFILVPIIRIVSRTHNCVAMAFLPFVRTTTFPEVGADEGVGGPRFESVDQKELQSRRRDLAARAFGLLERFA